MLPSDSIGEQCVCFSHFLKYVHSSSAINAVQTEVAYLAVRYEIVDVRCSHASTGVAATFRLYFDHQQVFAEGTPPHTRRLHGFEVAAELCCIVDELLDDQASLREPEWKGRKTRKLFHVRCSKHCRTLLERIMFRVLICEDDESFEQRRCFLQAGDEGHETLMSFRCKRGKIVLVGDRHHVTVVADLIVGFERQCWWSETKAVQVTQHCLDGVGIIALQFDVTLVCFLQCLCQIRVEICYLARLVLPRTDCLVRTAYRNRQMPDRGSSDEP